jgi:hypothetical protein
MPEDQYPLRLSVGDEDAGCRDHGRRTELSGGLRGLPDACSDRRAAVARRATSRAWLRVSKASEVFTLQPPSSWGCTSKVEPVPGARRKKRIAA